MIAIYLFACQECLSYGSGNFNLHSFLLLSSVIGVCMQVILGSYGVDFSSISTGSTSGWLAPSPAPIVPNGFGWLDTGTRSS